MQNDNSYFWIDFQMPKERKVDYCKKGNFHRKEVMGTWREKLQGQ